MRLTDQQRDVIVEEAARAFGPGAVVRLFGSRVDDRLRGGDIDLHITPGAALWNASSAAERLQAQLRMHARLMRRLGERKIDLVVQLQDRDRPIDRAARRQGIVLEGSLSPGRSNTARPMESTG